MQTGLVGTEGDCEIGLDRPVAARVVADSAGDVKRDHKRTGGAVDAVDQCPLLLSYGAPQAGTEQAVDDAVASLDLWHTER